MITGISHITFIVSDLEKMSQLLINVFDAEEIYHSKEKNFSTSTEKFFLIGELWVAIMEGNPLLERTYNHIAFKISENDINKYKKRLKDLGLEIQESRTREPEEGLSLYFYDYDNHLFELHTGTLSERLEFYKNSESILQKKTLLES